MALLERLIVSLVLAGIVGASWKPTVYQKIRQTSKLSYYFTLLESNRPAKINLQYGELTVFVPTNEAFEWYSGSNLHDSVNYHMIWYARRLKDLRSGSVLSVIEESPPVWITRLEEDVYVNNARVIPEISDYVSEIRSRPKKPQVLHVIDEVLDPIIRRNTQAVYKPTAYDFLAHSEHWNLGYKFDLFGRKVLGNRIENVFKADGNFTFFVPIDDGFTDYRLQMTDTAVLLGHVVPNRVLFTRPTAKDTPFETLANDDYLYVVVVFSQASDGKLYVKSHTLNGDSNHPAGEIEAEIVRPNIPIKNGVVHLIKRPLVVFDRRLTLFPYLPVLDKLTGDPFLSRAYSAMKDAGFTRLFANENLKFTLFVPRNKGFDNLQNFLEVNRTLLDSFVAKYGRGIFSRHVIVSNSSYTMEELRRNFNETDVIANVNVTTLGGVLQVGIGERDDKYVVYWRNQAIPVYRENYHCTNGIIHVIDNFFVNEEDFDVEESGDSGEGNPLRVLNMLIRLTL